MDEIVIWWLTQNDCTAIGKDLPESFPEYVRREYRSRLGSAGRARLWASKHFGFVGIYPWPNTPLSKSLEAAGGIVIYKRDLPLLTEMPGLCTDIKLQRLEVSAVPEASPLPR
jgi:hypothetical protein